MLEWIAVIAGLLGSGAIGGIILHFLTKKNTNKLTEANLQLTATQTRKLEQEMEAQYVGQLEKWLSDLREIHEEHEKSIIQKDQEISLLHKQHLDSIRELDETRIRLDRTGRATQRLMSKADTPYWECDGFGKFTYVNGAWSLLTGLQDAESLGNKWMSIIHKDDEKAAKLAWYSSMVDLNDSPIRFRIVNPVTGETIPVKFIYSTIHDVDGKVVKVIGVVIKLHNTLHNS